MSALSQDPVATEPAASPRASVAHALWSGLAVAAMAVVVATIAIEAMPHTRGLAFLLPLRYAVVAPACFVVAGGAALAYRAFAARFKRPRMVVAGAVAGLAVLALFGMVLGGPTGLAGAAAPALVGTTALVAWLVPRLGDRPRRSRFGKIVTSIFAGLELFALVGALASESKAPSGPPGLAFEIPRTLFDVEHKFMELPNGTRIHYVDEGTGETLLFLHGNPSWSFQWRDLIGGLRGSYRCVALDYPGFGLSTAPARFGYTPLEQSRVVEDVVDRLGLHDVTMVLQDWGGPIGVGFAERRPELVRAIVLGSTWAWPTEKGAPRGGWSVVAGGPIGEFAQMNFNAIVSFSLSSSIIRKLPTDVRDLYERPFLPLDRRGVATFYPREITAESAYFREIEAGLPRLATKSALIFWALQDVGFPRSDLARWEAALPNHKTIELPNANHFFFEDTADQVIAEIRAFAAPRANAQTAAP